MKRYFLLSAFSLSLYVVAGDYNSLVQDSFKYIEQDSLYRAQESLKQALRLEPANSQNCMLLSNLGTIQRRLNNNEEAIISYSSALMLAPKSITLLENRAALYSEMEEWDKAITDYTTILYLEADHEESLYRRGMIKIAQKEDNSARIDFETILKVNPQSAKARIGIALLLRNSGDYMNAADIYTQVIKVNPSQPDLYFKRSEIYYLAGKNAKAAEDINFYIDKVTDDSYAYVLRGKIRFAQYDKRAAASDFNKAKSLGYEHQEELEKMIKKCK